MKLFAVKTREKKKYHLRRVNNKFQSLHGTLFAGCFFFSSISFNLLFSVDLKPLRILHSLGVLTGL